MSESKEQLRAQMAEFEMTVSNVLERRNSWYSDIPLTSPASTIAQSPLDIKSPSPKPLSSVQVIIMAIRTLSLLLLKLTLLYIPWDRLESQICLKF